MKRNFLATAFCLLALSAAGCEDELRKRVARNREDEALWLRNVLAAEVRMRERGQAAVPKLTRLLEEAGSVPGMEQRAIADTLPGAWREHQISILPGQMPGILHVVSPGYFEVMELRLLQGRDFSRKDVDSSLPVAIVNRPYAGGGDVLGRQIQIQRSPVKLTVVGVVEDNMPHYVHEVYVPYTQHSTYSSLYYGGYEMRNGEPAWYLLARVPGGRKARARPRSVGGLELRTLEARLKHPRKPEPPLTAEGDMYIETGTPKDKVLDWFGAPERRAVVKGSLLIDVSSDPDPMRSCRRAQPADEVWHWYYRDFFVVVSDGEVLYFQRSYPVRGPS